MYGASKGFFDLCSFCVSRPNTFYPKGFLMLKKLNFRERLLAAGVAVTAVASQASAAGLTVPASIDLADFMAVAGIVVIASAAMWGVRKAIGLIH